MKAIERGPDFHIVNHIPALRASKDGRAAFKQRLEALHPSPTSSVVSEILQRNTRPNVEDNDEPRSLKTVPSLRPRVQSSQASAIKVLTQLLDNVLVYPSRVPKLPPSKFRHWSLKRAPPFPLTKCPKLQSFRHQSPSSIARQRAHISTCPKSSVVSEMPSLMRRG